MGRTTACNVSILFERRVKSQMIQLHANVCGKAVEDDSTALMPVIHMQDLEEAVCSWLWADAALTIGIIWKVNQPMEDFCVSVSVTLSNK